VGNKETVVLMRRSRDIDGEKEQGVYEFKESVSIFQGFEECKRF
jgi:hypothetical protein